MFKVPFAMILALTATQVFAVDLTHEECDAQIHKAFQVLNTENRVAGFNLLNSESTKNCFKRFPDLETKYFPVKFNESGASHDPAYTVHWN